jgi:hypothetical protein
MRDVSRNSRRAAGVLLALFLLAGLALPHPARSQNGSAASVGQWGGVMSWPEPAIHSQLLPTGKVMFNARTSVNYVWDPNTGSVGTLALNSYSIFCTGHALLADGKLLVSGGHVSNGVGLPYASLYDPFTNAWTRLPNHNAARWYPTCVTLSDGSVLSLSGSMAAEGDLNDLPQVLQTNGNWRNLTSARLSVPLYPNLFLAPNGKVFVAGPGTVTRYLDTNGSGAWTTVANRSAFRDYGPGVLYDTGKVLLLGGGDPPTASAEVIDLNAANPAWRAISSLSVARRHANATILPDGKVLVTGGVYGSGFNNTGTPIYSVELWDPATERFTLMASQSQPRWYHSTALLLPDGRVLTAGGEDTKTAQVYSPPYLFKGARPTIASAPGSVGYGQSFFVGTPQAGSIAQVTWIRLASVTHTNDMNQRINRLAFSQASGGLNVTTPGSANLAPPGHYMLFLVDSNGVPSVARILQISGASGTVPAPPNNLVAAPVSSSQINLSWSDVSGNEAGFVLERSTNGTSFTQIATLGPNVTSYANTGLSPATTYYYHLYAYNSVGSSPYSSTAQTATLAGAPNSPPPSSGSPPAVPSNLKAVAASATQVNLTWTDNSGDEDGFAVERAVDGQPWIPIATVGAGVTSYASTGLAPATTYWFRVRASKAGAFSDFAPAVVVGTGTGPATPPPTPVSPPATAPSNLVAATISGSQINLAWNDNGGQEDGFAIERSTNGTSFSQVVTVGPNTTSYADVALAGSTLYYYRVAAFNSVGKSAFSNTAQATTASAVPTGPPTPTQLTATTVSTTQIRLAWASGAGFKDGIKIERSLDGSNFSQIAIVIGSATSFLNADLAPGVLYYYRVRAFLGVSNSAYSNVTVAATSAGGPARYVPPSGTGNP